MEPNTKTKESHYTEAAANLNRADSALQSAGAPAEDEPVSVAMGKSETKSTVESDCNIPLTHVSVSLYLARGQPSVAQPLVERLLVRQPNNVIALMAQASFQTHNLIS